MSSRDIEHWRRTAADEATSGAARSGVDIAPVALPAELDELRGVMHQVWGPEIVPPRNLLRGLALGGANLLVARRGDRPVGFALGWLGWEGGVHLHSHQVGVLAEERSSGVGFALKLAQRAQCLDRGITEMRWTFDPLLATNAAFNLGRLGARVVDFLPDCYGRRTDSFNTGDITDRLEVSWRLDAAVGGAVFDAAALASVRPLIDVDGVPRRSAEPATVGSTIPVPPAYHRLRAEDPEVGDAWRSAVGATLTDVVAAGLRIVAWTPSGYLVGVW
jgi:predicted GNAT superfamily acetyltransferase